MGLKIVLNEDKVVEGERGVRGMRIFSPCPRFEHGWCWLQSLSRIFWSRLLIKSYLKRLHPLCFFFTWWRLAASLRCPDKIILAKDGSGGRLSKRWNKLLRSQITGDIRGEGKSTCSKTGNFQGSSGRYHVWREKQICWQFSYSTVLTC